MQKEKLKILLKKIKILVTNNKNVNEKLNETDSKRINLEKAVRLSKDEANDFKK